MIYELEKFLNQFANRYSLEMWTRGFPPLLGRVEKLGEGRKKGMEGGRRLESSQMLLLGHPAKGRGLSEGFW
jgi:hypothetical protein